MTLASRIIEARQECALSKAELARRVGVTRATVSMWESGQIESLKDDNLLSLSDLLDVNPRWLNSGRGPKRGQPLAGSVQMTEPAAAYTLLTRVRGSMQSAVNGRVSWEHEEIDSAHAFRRDWMRRKGLAAKDCRILGVTGDSMAPYLQDGDVVLVNMADRTIRNGEVYAIAVDEELRVKRLTKRADGALEVRSDKSSPQYPVEVVDRARVERLNIIGRVVWRGG
jgi:phage repressor protein C with HTH and peptisase S24 domain